MALQMLKRIRTTDKTLERIQTAIGDAFNPITKKQLVDGFYLEDVALVAGDNSIDHLLERRLRGWVVCRKSAAVDIYDKQDANDTPDKTLVLNSSGPARVSLWVF